MFIFLGRGGYITQWVKYPSSPTRPSMGGGLIVQWVKYLTLPARKTWVSLLSGGWGGGTIRNSTAWTFSQGTDCRSTAALQGSCAKNYLRFHLQRPTLNYSGLHDRPLKHYFNQPDVRVTLTQFKAVSKVAKVNFISALICYFNKENILEQLERFQQL